MSQRAYVEILSTWEVFLLRSYVLCAYVEILSTWEVFLLRSYVFVLNLTESLLKSVKIALKKIVKSILRNRKTINSSKNSFGKK